MKLHFVESMDEVLKIALEREIVRAADAGPADRGGNRGAVRRKRTVAH